MEKEEFFLEDRTICVHLQHYIDNLLSLIEGTEESDHRIITGLSAFDEGVGLRRKENRLVIVESRGRSFKSALLYTLTLGMLKKDLKVLFWSPVNSEKKVLDRFISALGNVKLDKLETGSIDTEEINEIENAADKLFGMPLTLIDNEGLGIDEFCLYAKEAVEKGNIDAVIIDDVDQVDAESYVYGVLDEERLKSVSDKLSKLGVPVIMSVTESDKRAEEDLKALREIADNVIYLRDTNDLESDDYRAMMMYVAARCSRTKQYKIGAILDSGSFCDHESPESLTINGNIYNLVK